MTLPEIVGKNQYFMDPSDGEVQHINRGSVAANDWPMDFPEDVEVQVASMDAIVIEPEDLPEVEDRGNGYWSGQINHFLSEDLDRLGQDAYAALAIVRYDRLCREQEKVKQNGAHARRVAIYNALALSDIDIEATDKADLAVQLEKIGLRVGD